MEKNFQKKATALLAMLLVCVSLSAQDVVSIDEALRLYKSQNKAVIDKALKAQGYQYQQSHVEDGFNTTHSWYKNCTLNSRGAVSRYLAGTTSICDYIVYKNGQREMTINVFNKKAKDAIFQQVRNAGYAIGEGMPAYPYGEMQWICTKAGMPEIMLSVPMNENTGKVEDTKGYTVLISQ